MKFKKSKKELKSIIMALESPNLAVLVEAMLAFYRDQRADKVDVEADGDMLLYQWGVSDWGDGEFFEFEIVRQFIDPKKDEPFQLMLTMKFQPTEQLRAIEDDNQWCESPDALEDFRAFIESSEAYNLLQTEKPDRTEIEFEQC
ncbi:MAG: hypothetical protein AAGC72_15070 [Planctomycetota bacterium]